MHIFPQQCQTSPVSLTKSSFPSLPALLCVSDPVLLQKVEAKIHPAENFYVNVKCRKLLCSHGNSLWSRCLQPSNFTSLGCHALKKNVFKKKPEKLFKIWCIIYLHFFLLAHISLKDGLGLDVVAIWLLCAMLQHPAIFLFGLLVYWFCYESRRSSLYRIQKFIDCKGMNVISIFYFLFSANMEAFQTPKMLLLSLI